MKALKHLATGILIAAGVLLSACSNKDDAYLRLSGTTCAFGAKGGDKSIAVSTNGSEWTMSVEGDNADWFSVTKKADGILVHAPLNTTEQVKRTSIVISGSIPATIDVIQEAGQVPALVLVPSDEQYGFTSSGGSLTIAVSSTYVWTVSCPDTWCVVTTDMKSNTLTVSAGQNIGGKQTAVVTVTSGPEGLAKTKTLTITQYTAAEHPYLSLIGDWNLHSDKWSYGGLENTGTGTHASFAISQGVMNETFLVKGRFYGKSEANFMPFELEIDFDADNGSIGLPLGWYVGQAGDYYIYLNEIDMKTNHTKAGYVTGIVSVDRTTIRLEGFTKGYGMGIVGVKGSDRVKFSDLYYATGEEMTLKLAPKPSASHCFVISEKTTPATKGRAACSPGTISREATSW